MVLFHSVAAFPPNLPSLEGPEFAAMRPAKFDRDFFLSKRPTVYSTRYVGYQFSDEGKTPEDLDAEIREVYSSLPHNPVVARVLSTAREKLGSDNYAVLHVRKGDVGEMIRRDLPPFLAGRLDRQQFEITLGHYLGRTAPFDFYYSEIERCLGEGLRIVFTSDSPETLAHFAKKFGVKHFIDINKFVRARLPIQKAFLDFNIMIGAKRIITTRSTYSVFAATLGGTELADVTRSGSLERSEEFFIEEYAPDLASNHAVRRMLLEEMRQVRESPRKAAT